MEGERGESLRIQVKVRQSERKVVDACIWIKLGMSLPSEVRVEYMLLMIETGYVPTKRKWRMDLAVCAFSFSSSNVAELPLTPPMPW